MSFPFCAPKGFAATALAPWLLLGSALGVAAPALSLPAVGSPAPPVELDPVDGQPQTLSASLGRPALIVYESRGCKDQNDPFKRRLKELAEAKGDYRTRVALFPVADLEGLAFWPIKGFVEHAVRGESRKIGWSIYCDWDGALRKKLGVKRDLSTVILVDRAGKVIFAAEGPLADEAQTRVLALLQGELGA